MNGSETEALRAILRAELSAAIAELELRLVNRFAPAALEVEVESLRRWRSFTKGALTAVSAGVATATALAGIALKVVLG